MRFFSHVCFWREESRRRESEVRNVEAMTESPDTEQVLVCSSISAAWTWPLSVSWQRVSMCQFMGQTPMEIPSLEQELLGCTAPCLVPYQESWKEGGHSVWFVAAGSIAELQPPAWITEHFGSAVSSVWGLFLNSASPCLCSSGGFSRLLRHFPP